VTARQVRGFIQVGVTGLLVNRQGRRCAGRVAVGVTVGGRRARRVVKLNSNCRYKVTLRIRVNSLPRRLRSRKRRLLARVTVAYRGTSQIRPARPPSRLTRVIR